MISSNTQYLAQNTAPIKAKSLPPGVRQWLSQDKDSSKDKSNRDKSLAKQDVGKTALKSHDGDTLQKPQKPQWECQITSPPQVPEKGYTVGEVFTLSCQGSEIELEEPIQLKWPEDKEYSIVLLKKLELTKTKIAYEATSYRTGNNEHPFLDFVDGANKGFISQPLKISVGSVMPQPPPESPYGPVAPFYMGWPVWLFFSALIIVTVILGWGVLYLRRRLQRKKLEKNIRKFLSPLGSYHQFSKDIRKLRSGVLFSERYQWTAQQVETYLVQLDEHFRMFLLREFTVPATTWSSRQTQNDIRVKAKVSYHIFGESLRKAFQEMDRALGVYDKMTSHDCDQLTKMVMKTVDMIWSCRTMGRKS